MFNQHEDLKRGRAIKIHGGYSHQMPSTYGGTALGTDWDAGKADRVAE